MKREKEVPLSLIDYLSKKKNREENQKIKSLDLICSVPVKAVKMRIYDGHKTNESFCTVIIPPVDIYAAGEAELRPGFLRRDILAYMIAGTKKVFPYGHVYASTGYICLGSIFVPSAVPERSPSMPLETLFLHNDRNLSHGNSHLFIRKEQASAIDDIIKKNDIMLNVLGSRVVNEPGIDIIKNDEIWNLSVCVARQKMLPEALDIMEKIYDIVFEISKNSEKEEERQNE